MTVATTVTCRWCGGELTLSDVWEPSNPTWRHAATNRVICKRLMRLAEPRVTEDGGDGGN